MKKSLLLAVLCLCSVAAGAQNMKGLLHFGFNYRTPDFKQSFTPLPEQKALATPDQGGNAVQGFGALQTLNFFNPVFGYYMPSTIPIVYDKTTKNVYLIYNEQTADANNNIGVNMKLLTSSAPYKTFSSTVKLVTTSAIDYLGMPQLAVMNPDNATTTDGLNFMVMARQYPNSAEYHYTSPTFYLRSSAAAADEFALHGPERNNSAQYNFGAGGLVGFWNSSVEGFVHAGVLDPPTSNEQYGQYGAFVFEASSQGTQSSLPTAWDNSQFKSAPATTSSYNGPMYVDADPDGVCYAAINSIFTSDENSRVISFSTSTDLGGTWSDFNKMPSTVMDQYASDRGFAQVVAIQPYQQDAFIVTGSNRFSYFFRAALYDANQTLGALDIVEAEYNNGTWSMRKVADFNDVPYVFVSNDSVNQLSNYSVLKTFRILNPLGNELEAARTADGQSVVLKWIDYNMDLGPTVLSPAQSGMEEDPQNQGVYNDITIDTLYSTDVYVSYRDLSSSTWNNTVNLTNDKTYDIGTHMPRTVPSVDQIPMVSSRAVPSAKWTGSSAASSLFKSQPADYMSRIYNLWSNVYYSPFSVQVGVEDEKTATASGLQFSALMPNPSNDQSMVTFSTQAPGHLTAQLTNELGEKIATVYDDMIGEGVHAFPCPTSQLASGMYFVSITMNGKTVTKSLVVAH